MSTVSGVPNPPLLLRDNASTASMNAKVDIPRGDVIVYAVGGDVYKTHSNKATGVETTQKLAVETDGGGSATLDQPNFGVARLSSNLLNVSTSTPTLIPFNAAVENYGGVVVASNGRLQCGSIPTDNCTVVLQVQLSMQQMSGFGNATKVYLYKNGSAYREAHVENSSSSTMVFSYTFLARATSSDYFDVRVLHSASGADVLSGTDPDDSFFSLAVVNTFDTPAS